MKMHTAQVTRKAWKAEGNPPCNHPHIEEEQYDDGRLTGDYVCTTCGAYMKPQAEESSESQTKASLVNTPQQSILRQWLRRLGW
jgi:hypothetical protein